MRTNKKKLQTRGKMYATNEVKRYLGVLQEQNDGHMKVIGEELQHINRRLDGHTEAVGTLTTKVSEIEVTLHVMEEKMEVMKGDIEFIKTGFKKKVDVDEFAALERRVLLLERKTSR